VAKRTSDGETASRREHGFNDFATSRTMPRRPLLDWWKASGAEGGERIAKLAENCNVAIGNGNGLRDLAKEPSNAMRKISTKIGWCNFPHFVYIGENVSVS
jgi:hypothetical protein